jgi:hypothetical protein
MHEVPHIKPNAWFWGLLKNGEAKEKRGSKRNVMQTKCEAKGLLNFIFKHVILAFCKTYQTGLGSINMYNS